MSPSSKVVVPMELSSLVSGFTAVAEAASANGPASGSEAASSAS